MSATTETLTLIGQGGFIFNTFKIYLVGERVKGGQSTLKVVTQTAKGENTKTIKRKLVPHARVNRSIPQANFWFAYDGKDFTVYDLPEKIRQAS